MNVKILSHEYNIDFDYSSCLLEDDDPDEFIAACRPYQLQIYINENQPLTTRMESFLHECLEAIVNRLDVNIKHEVLNILGEVYFAVLKDNGLLNLDTLTNLVTPNSQTATIVAPTSKAKSESKSKKD